MNNYGADGRTHLAFHKNRDFAYEEQQGKIHASGCCDMIPRDTPPLTYL